MATMPTSDQNEGRSSIQTEGADSEVDQDVVPSTSFLGKMRSFTESKIEMGVHFVEEVLQTISGSKDNLETRAMEYTDVDTGIRRRAGGSIAELKTRVADLMSRGSIKNEIKKLSMMTGKQKIWYFAKNSLLKVVFAAIMGLIIGLASRDYDPRSPLVVAIQVPGIIFKDCLNCVVIPLMVSSIISGLSSLDTRMSRKVGMVTGLYFLFTTLLGCLTGIAITSTIRPGYDAQHHETAQTIIRRSSGVDTFLNLIRLLIPKNFIEMCVMSWRTEMKERNLTNSEMIKYKTTRSTMTVPEFTKVDGTNMLGLVAWSLLFGIALHLLGEKGEPMREFFDSLFDTLLHLTTSMLFFAPIGVVSLIAIQIHTVKDLGKMFKMYAYYIWTALVGLLIHCFITQPLVYYVVVRKNPYKFMHGLMQTMFTALGTASSSVALPVTMRNLLINNRIDMRVIAFVVPVGVTINMDGLAIYQTVAATFIAQLTDTPLDIIDFINMITTAIAASIGAAGVPMGGIVAIVAVLNGLGLGSEYVGIIITFDWIIDRCVTVVNVMGDAWGAGIVQKITLPEELGTLNRISTDQMVVAMADGNPLLQRDIGDILEAEMGSRRTSVATDDHLPVKDEIESAFLKDNHLAYSLSVLTNINT